MSKEKQIEEMAHALCGQEHSCGECDSDYRCEFILECSVLHRAGYRKQSEGEWRDRGVVKRISTENAPIVECSECNITFCDIINNHYFMYHYCPNCGAKMKGGAE